MDSLSISSSSISNSPNRKRSTFNHQAIKVLVRRHFHINNVPELHQAQHNLNEDLVSEPECNTIGRFKKSKVLSCKTRGEGVLQPDRQTLAFLSGPAPPSPSLSPSPSLLLARLLIPPDASRQCFTFTSICRDCWNSAALNHIRFLSHYRPFFSPPNFLLFPFTLLSSLPLILCLISFNSTSWS